jgi:hypothetical protein
MKPKSELILYQTEDNRTRIEVRLENETVWLSLNQLAELFQRDKSVISRHIKNIFEEGELRPESVVANYATTAADAKTYQVEYFNLDVIISVGYRVKSQRGTQFPALTTIRVTRPNHEDAAILPSSPGFRLRTASNFAKTSLDKSLRQVAATGDRAFIRLHPISAGQEGEL